MFTAGPEGLSPFQEAMAEVGLPVTSLRVLNLTQEAGIPISDRDWVQAPPPAPPVLVRVISSV